MCGIFFSFIRSNADLALAEKAWKTLQHRGPDGSRCELVREHGVFLGFHRLAIVNLDIMAGMQPFRGTNGARLVCNGEIYNHKALGDAATDVAVILDILQHIDIADDEAVVSSLGKLDGDFALVYMDAHGRVLLARDPIGVKPLYCAYDGHDNIIAAASEIKALVGLDVHRVQHLRPGTFVRVGSSAGVEYVDWTLPMQVTPGDVAPALTEAVRKRVEHGERKVAFICSGGFDSSVITCLANDLRPQSIHAFSVQIGDEDSHDTRYARRLMQALGIHHTVVRITQEEAMASWDEVVRVCETSDFFSIQAAVPLYFLAKYIREKTDYKVVLGGEGADEAHMGYNHFKLVPNDVAAVEESLRLIRQIYAFDLLRAERCFSAHGLEIRVPFLDTHFLRVSLALPGNVRRPQGQREKPVLRDAFRHFTALRDTGILERRKMTLSDGTGISPVLHASSSVLEERCKTVFMVDFAAHDEVLLIRSMPDWVKRFAKPIVLQARKIRS